MQATSNETGHTWVGYASASSVAYRGEPDLALGDAETSRYPDHPPAGWADWIAAAKSLAKTKGGQTQCPQ